MTTIDHQKGLRRTLRILEARQFEKKILEKLKEYGRLLKKKHNRKERHKVLKELKELAKEL